MNGLKKKIKAWCDKDGFLAKYGLAFLVSLALCIDYANVEKVFKGLSSVIVPVFVFFGVLFLVKKNRTNERDKALMVLSFCFAVCQIIAGFYNRDGSLIFAVSSVGEFIKTVLVLLGYAVGFYQLIKYLLTLVQQAKKKTCKNKAANFVFEKHPFMASCGIILLAYLPFLFVFYPGIVQNDTFDEFSQYYCLETWSNDYINPEYEDSCINTHHSPFHTVVIGSINNVVYDVTGKANYALFANVALQMVMAVVIFAYSLRVMNKLGVQYWIRFLTIILYCFLPYCNIWAITLAKDVPFSLMVVLYVCFLIEFFVLEQKSWKDVLKIIVCAMLLILLSNKSIYFIIPISVMVMFVLKPRHRLALAVIPIVFYSVYSMVLLPAFHVNSGSIREPLALPIQQVSKVVKYHFDELSDEEKDAIGGILDYKEIGGLYNDTSIDPVKNNLFNKDYSQDELKGFLGAWISLGWKYPIDYTSTFLYLYSSNLWIEGNNGVAYFKTERSRDYEKLDYKVSRWRQEKMSEIEQFYYDLKKMPIIGLLCHNAFYVWSIILFLVVMMKKKEWRKKVLVVFLPVIVMTLFLFVSPVANNKRYFLPMVYCAPVLFAFFFYYFGKLKNNKK